MQFSGSFRKMALSALVVSVGALSGCVVNGGGQADDGYYEEDSRGYPPARPRNGYRYAYPSGPSLIFDSGLGMYAVYGQPDYYFHDGYFYRWNSGNWNRSRYWNRRWERCDSRHWPRPIYQVNNNYYGKGKRPRHDWDRNDRDGRGDNDGRGNHDGRGEHDGRGDHGGQPGEQHGGRPTPGPGHGGRDGDVNGDGQRERGERYMQGNEQVAREQQHRRELDQQLRDRSRERDPVDHRRQPDADGARGPDQNARSVRDAAIREQATRRSAERAAVEQRGRERGERQAAEQAEHAQRREAERKRDDTRREEQQANDGEASRRGGARGDNWEDVRGDRR